MSRSSELRRLAKTAEEALERAAGATTFPPTPVGIPGGQTGNATSFTVFATTVDAAAVTVDTGYKPASGHAAKIDGGISLTDRTAHTANSKNSTGSVRNYGGLAIAGTPTVSGTSGDAALNAAAVTFGVSGGGTLEVIFTPPGGYVGTIDWIYGLNLTEN